MSRLQAGSLDSAYSRDLAGRVTGITDGSFTYTWDALNRLVQVQESGTSVATYGYDSQNRRIRKSVGRQTIQYHYDLNNQLIAESLATAPRCGIISTSTTSPLPCGNTRTIRGCTFTSPTTSAHPGG